MNRIVLKQSGLRNDNFWENMTSLIDNIIFMIFNALISQLHRSLYSTFS